MARTDWQMNDTVQPADMNQIGQEINQNRNDLDAHTATTTGVHGATSAATPNTIIQRDSSGRAKVAAPVDADDIARKDTVDVVQSNLTTHIADYVRQPGYGVASGSANTYVVTLNPAPTSYIEGMAIAVKINVDNTGAATINVNGLGAKPIKKPNGNDVSAGNLRAGSIYTFRYNGVNFILQAEGSGGTAQPGDVLSGKTFTNDAGEQVGTMVNRAGDTAALSSTIAGTTLKLLASAGFRDGVDDYVTITDPDFVAANIKNGVNIFGLMGTFDGLLRAKVTQNPANVVFNSGSGITVFTLSIPGLNFTPVVAYIQGYSEFIKTGGSLGFQNYGLSATTNTTNYITQSSDINVFYIYAEMSNVTFGECTLTVKVNAPVVNNQMRNNQLVINLFGI